MRPIADRGLLWCQADRPGAVRGYMLPRLALIRLIAERSVGYRAL